MSMENMICVSVVLRYHKLITVHRLTLVCLHLEKTNCRGTHDTDVDTVEVLQITELSETIAATQTPLRGNRHQIIMSCIVYHTMNKRNTSILELQMVNMNLFTQLKTFRVITNCECFANNKCIIPSLQLLKLNRKLKNSGEAERQVNTIIKKKHLYKKLKETHSKNFIM
ncbi:unnamed protein product [Mytilus coruscus]|uniref:Uncharacterized protein n=1 Tax=Mytilus coruscus TaxID=42192 RepID=A0A6J8AI78_MYTCO|nr:unnamed protein product [Mytilus coruscus]